MAKVSVIISTYNRAHLVTEAIDSVLQQSFKDFEVIVVDDGSTDHTGEVLHERYKDRIHYIYQENQGTPARNTGINISKGHYIAFLDSDDLWLPHKLEKQVSLIETLPERVGMIFCSMYVQEGSDGRDTMVCYRYTHRGNILKSLLLSEAMASPSRVLIKKECLEKVGLFNESLKRSEDTELWIRISQYFDADFVEEPLVIKRHLDSHIMGDPGTLEDVSAIYEKIFDNPDIPEDIKKLKNKAYARRLLNYMGEYYKSNMTGKMWECFTKALLYDIKSIKRAHFKILLLALLKKLSK
ncbi:MAG: glycosyltransferase family 2 protein [Candidatus Xenobiia bacterium LiM19]